MICESCDKFSRENYRCKKKQVPRQNRRGAFFCVSFFKRVDEKTVKETAYGLSVSAYREAESIG